MDRLSAATRWLLEAALAEDVGTGDVTTRATVPPDATARAEIVAKAPGVLAGGPTAAAVFRAVEPRLDVRLERADGDRVRPGDVVLTVTGPAAGVLIAERTALNFLQRLSGVATLTRAFADAVAGTDARILDTRKTTPGWRELEKRAVLAGGGANHRHGLFDMVLLKENHVALAGGIAAAVRAARAATADLEVEVEVRDLGELDAALEAGADRVLLDNMDLDAMREAVRRARARGGVRVEASGNMRLDRVRDVALTGVDDISVGALTHSAPALDLSLLVRL